jgi:hypothetical protein
MPLVASVLKTQLENMVPVSSEAECIINFASAWENYIKDAAVMGAPTAPGTLTAALASLKAAMVGCSAPNPTVASTKIAAGITAFWGTVAGAAPTIWTVPQLISATPPPGLGGLQAAIEAVFQANVAAKLDIGPAAQALANAIHPLQLGGIAVFPPPPTGIGPQPIL